MQASLTLRRLGSVTILDAPPSLLGEQRRCQVRLIISGVSCRTYACRLQHGEAAIIVPRTILDRLGLHDRQSVVANCITKETGSPHGMRNEV